jgi:hypothetical protein
MSFHERTDVYAKRVNVKKEIIAENARSKVDIECTFHPRTRHLSKYSLTENFFKRQEVFLNQKKQNIEDKLNQKEVKESKEILEKPRICLYSRFIANIRYNSKE